MLSYGTWLGVIFGDSFPAVIRVAAGNSHDTRNLEKFQPQTKSTKCRKPCPPHDDTYQSFRWMERLFKKRAIGELHTSSRWTADPLGRLQAQITIINQQNSPLLRQFIHLYIRRGERIVESSQPIMLPPKCALCSFLTSYPNWFWGDGIYEQDRRIIILSKLAGWLCFERTSTYLWYTRLWSPTRDDFHL